MATGFLFNGRLISDELNNLPLFLTCNHVTSLRGDNPFHSLPPSELAVDFPQMKGDGAAKGEASFLQSLCESPTRELNYTLLLLDRWPGSVEDPKIAPRSPKHPDNVFVLSYPRGGGLTITLDGNVIEPTQQQTDLGGYSSKQLIHYDAPTEPGSSGAPVFNEHWEIVALHIGGNSRVANFGTSIEAVLADARSLLSGLSIPRLVRESIVSHDDASPAILQEATSYFSVFISYRHEDVLFARRLYNAFEASGVHAWLDETAILPGEFIDAAIQKGIAAADRFVLCCSQASLENSWWVDSEVTSIFEKERELSQAAGRKLSVVIPVLLDDYLTKSWKGGKAPELRNRLGVDFKEWQDDKRFAASFEKLLKGLRAPESAKKLNGHDK